MGGQMDGGKQGGREREVDRGGTNGQTDEYHCTHNFYLIFKTIKM